ncbi:MAG: restriction endonuclease [Candidatus Heimdallarchaeota archaeon]
MVHRRKNRYKTRRKQASDKESTDSKAVEKKAKKEAIIRRRVDKIQLEEYIRVYKDKLLAGIKGLREGQQRFFEFQKEQPMHIKGFISKKHGAAVTFRPASEEIIEIKIVSNEIETIIPKVPQDTSLKAQNGPDLPLKKGDRLLQHMSFGVHAFSPVYTINGNINFVKAFFQQQKNELVIIRKPFNLELDEESVYTIVDRLIMKGSNNVSKWDKTAAVHDALAKIQSKLGEQITELEKGHLKLKTALGIASEAAVRELCQKFDGRTIDGGSFGLSGKLQLPKNPKVVHINEPEIDALLTNHETWVVEVKRRSKETSIKDLKTLEEKGIDYNAKKAWFISEEGFKENSIAYAEKKGILISTWKDLHKVAKEFNMRIP